MTSRLNYQKEFVEKKQFDLELIKRLWRYLSPHSWMLGIGIFCLLVAKGIEVIVPLLLGHVVQNLFDRAGDVGTSCLWIIGLLVASYLFESVSVVLKNWVGQSAIFGLRNEVYAHILHLPLRYYDKNAVGRLMTRTIHDIDQLNQMFSENAVPMIGNIVLFLGIVSAAVYLDWRIGVVMAVLLPFALYHVNYFRVNQRRCFTSIRAIVSAMNSFVQEYLMGAVTIRRFGLHDRERKHFAALNDDYADVYKETIHYFAFFYAGIDLLQSLSLITVFALLVIFAPPETGFQAGTYFTFSLYALMLFRPLADLAERYNELQSAIASAERVFDVMEQKEEKSGGNLALEEIREIVFEDVWFAYHNEDWVLKGLSFTLRKGQSIALVGPTGAGKSSVLSLLLGFYPFQKGSIRVNGIEIKSYALEQLRKQFSVVLQDPVIFSGTLKDNIALGEEVNFGALKVHHLPENLSERAGNLSVGERQLIAMARAMAHQRSVFLLDEATASIDSETEKEIQEALKVLIEQSTSLVIAHRLSTIRDVSRILVLHEGRVAEEGSHLELLAKKGLYEKLYRLQFKD